MLNYRKNSKETLGIEAYRAYVETQACDFIHDLVLPVKMDKPKSDQLKANELLSTAEDVFDIALEAQHEEAVKLKKKQTKFKAGLWNSCVLDLINQARDEDPNSQSKSAALTGEQKVFFIHKFHPTRCRL